VIEGMIQDSFLADFVRDTSYSYDKTQFSIL